MADFQEETLKYHRKSFSTLVLVQAAILLASAADPNVQLNRAVDQIRGIERAVQDWDEDWVQTAAVERIGEVKVRYPTRWPTQLTEHDGLRLQIIGDPVQHVPHEMLLRTPGASFSLRGPNGVDDELVGANLGLPGWYTMGFRVEQPTTLADFQAIWDGLNSDVRISVGALTSGDLPARVRVTDQRHTDVHITSVRFDAVQLPPEDAEYILSLQRASPAAVRELSERVPAQTRARGSHNLEFIAVHGDLTQTAVATRNSLGAPPLPGDPPVFTIEVAIETIEIPVALQDKLRTQISADLSLGAFGDAFAELAESTTGIEALPIADLRAVLETRLRNTDRRIKVVGLEFPVGSLALWGAGFLVLAQLYFLIEFQHLAPKLKHHDVTFPWIAFFDGLLARSAFASLAFVTPALVILFVGWPVLQSEEDTLRTAIMVSLLMSSTAAGVSGALSYRSLLSRLRQTIPEG
ncbi:hypothetical protein [Ruegeria meonggei]|uniref:hypothetical protein n=1 Tax=Ruegeria meonggei TaxID=1446476 RepID=UPI003672F420